MFRRLFNALTLLSALLLLGMLALWVRSARHTDEITLRTAPSYVGWPPVKWFVVRTRDALVLSARTEVAPYVLSGLPPWREDVVPGAAVAMGDWSDAAVPKPVLPPNGSNGRAATAREHADYAARVAPGYATCPLLTWESGPAFPGDQSAQFANPVLRLLGVGTYGPGVSFVDEDRHPGSYRERSLRVPYPLAAAAAGLLPTAWVLARLRRRATTRRRMLAGLCPACGYDLRGGTGHCPECGRDAGPGTGGAPRRTPVRSAVAGIRPGRRAVVGAALVAACAAAVPALSHRGGPRHVSEEARWRLELDARVALIEEEADRLRRSSDTVGADGLEAALRTFRAGDRTIEQPELHVVGLHDGDYPGGARPPAPPLAGIQRSWSDLPPSEHPRGSAVVAVEAKDRPIVLVLCAYEPVKWELRLAPGVRLWRVILCGYADQDVTGLPPGVSVTPRHEAGRLPLDVYATRRETTTFTELESRLRQLTGLPVKTFQGRYRYGGEPFVVGPRDPAWAGQRCVGDLEPLYLRAARLRRDAARGVLRSLRFTAIWREDNDEEGSAGRRSPAEFDVDGPIRSSLLRGPGDVVKLAADEKAGCWYVLTEFGTNIVAIDAKGTFAARTIQLKPALRPSVIAFDRRRRRLMVLGRTDAGARGTPGGFYDADTGRWSPSILPVAGPPDYDSLTYSDADDCYYALGWASGAGGSVESITRIAPDGVPQWRVPVGERVTHNQRPGPAWRPQLAAAGKYLVVLTPPLPDPLDPAAPQRPRCVVIDPAANAVVYSGAMVPH